ASPAGPGAGVRAPARGRERGSDRGHGAGGRPTHRHDTRCRTAILGGDGGDQPLRGKAVETAGTRVRLLGRESRVARASSGHRAAMGGRHSGSLVARTTGCVNDTPHTQSYRVDLTWAHPRAGVSPLSNSQTPPRNAPAARRSAAT